MASGFNFQERLQHLQSPLTNRQFGECIQAILDEFHVNNPGTITLPNNLTNDDKDRLTRYIRDGVPDNVLPGLNARQRKELKTTIFQRLLPIQGGRKSRKLRKIRKRKTRRYL